MEQILLGIIFICVFLIVYKVGISFTAEEKRVRRRVMDLTDTEETFAELQDSFDQEQSGLAAVLEMFVRPFRKVEKERPIVQAKLYQGGFTSPNAAAYYLFFSTFGWIFGFIAFFMIAGMGMEQKGMIKYAYYILALLLGIGFTFGAKLMVKNAKEHRHKVLTNSFPDALDLLLICVESGLALDAALARVCRELKAVHPLITEELNRTRLELTLLNDRARALQNLADRTDLMAFKSLVAALLQSEKFGTSLVETLRVLSDDYRQTRMMLAEERAAKLDPKITAVTIPFMLIALMVLIMTPAVLEFQKNYKPATQSKKK